MIPRTAICLLMTAWVVTLGGAAAQDAAMPVERTLEYASAHTLRNDLLTVRVLPEAGGRIASLKFRGRDLLAVYRAEQLQGNPLFAPVTDNARGWGERFWKRPSGARKLPAQLSGASALACTLDSRYYANSTLSVRREMRLNPGASALEMRIRAASETTLPDAAQLWLTLFPAPGGTVFLPVRGGTHAIPGRGPIQAAATDRLLTPNLGGTTYYPAAGAFVWTRTNGVILALTGEDAAFLLSWGYTDVNGTARTAEIVLQKRNLPAEWVVRLLVFETLPMLRAVAGVRGFDLAERGGKRLLAVEAADNVPSQRCRIGNTVLTLPAQRRGECIFVNRPPELKQELFTVELLP